MNGFLSAPDPKPDTLDAYLWQDVMALSPHSAVVGSEYRAAWVAGYELAHQDHSWDGYQRNAFFANLGNHGFADASAVTGLDFRDDGRSFAVFDFDGDGDADLVIHSRTGPQLRLLRNDLASGNHSLAVRLAATHGNRDAIGARVEIETPSGRVVRWLRAGSGFLAQHSKELVFGLGQHSAGLTATVRWPGGDTERFVNLDAGFRYFFVEGQPSAPTRAAGTAIHGPSRRPQSADANAVQAEAPPDRFSAWLIDPVSLPTLPLFNFAGSMATLMGVCARQSSAFVWLWDVARPTVPKACHAFPGGSVGQLPAVLFCGTEICRRALKASSRSSRRALSRPMTGSGPSAQTLLTYISFDRRRPPVRCPSDSSWRMIRAAVL